MAYITKDEIKSIREALKKEFPNFRFSVKNRNHSTADIAIKSGPEDFSDILEGRGHIGINTYYTKEFYPEKEGFFDKIVEIAKTAPAVDGGKEWFDKSDSMTDYFHTAYYINVSVGEWNKPYILKAA